MKYSLKRLCGAGALVLPLSVWGLPLAQAAQPNSLYDQTATASGGLETFNQLQTQRDAINELRGQIEELRHQLDEQKQLSQQRYMDLEQRLDSDSSSADSNADPSNDPVNAAAGQLSSSTNSSNKQDAQQAYQDAFAKVKSREFDDAIKAFEGFTSTYPDSSLNANAYYWLGELYSAKSRLSDSEKAFQTVVDQYSNSSKMSDALYKLGLVQARLGKGANAMTTLKKVVNDYPNSDAAGKAQDFLNQSSQ